MGSYITAGTIHNLREARGSRKSSLPSVSA